MSWVKIDDRMGHHVKVVQAGNAAFGAWVRMLTWTCSQLTDGFIPRKIAEGFAKRSELKKLCEVRLIDPAKDGYSIHDFHDHNPHSTDVKARLESDKQRKAMGRKSQGRDAVGRVTSKRTSDGHPHGHPTEIRTDVQADIRTDVHRSDSNSNPIPIQVPTLTLPGGEGTGPSAGVVPQVVDALRGCRRDNAAETHDAAEQALVELGFAVQREYPVADRGDGRGGRVDLVAERDGVRVAIELDADSVREKSICKLLQVEDATRIVVLRDARDEEPPEGIDFVVGCRTRKVVHVDPRPAEPRPTAPERIPTSAALAMLEAARADLAAQKGPRL